MIKSNSLTCPSKDYDFYTIPFPARAFFKSQRKRYIFSQLEKLHPCFSDDCSFDTHFRIEKSGLKADIVVMQKYRLAEYKANKSRLFFKELKHHEFFQERKRRYLFWILAALIFPLFFLLPVNKEKPVQILPAENPHLPDTVPNEEPPLILQLLPLISSHAASLSDFSWSFDGYIESASMYLKGVFPEELQAFPSLSFSPVTFQGQSPLMTITFSRSSRGQASISQPGHHLNPASLRQIILQNNLVLIEESVRPASIKLQVENNQSAALAGLLEYFKEKNLCMNQIKIKSSRSQLTLELFFTDYLLYDLTEFYEGLIQNINVFFPREKITAKEMSGGGEPRGLQKPLAQTLQKPLNKVGQILKPDGSIETYYKDENGKIIKR